MGCTDSTYVGYHPSYNVLDQAQCVQSGIPGCTDPNSVCYNAQATFNGECLAAESPPAADPPQSRSHAHARLPPPVATALCARACARRPAQRLASVRAWCADGSCITDSNCVAIPGCTDSTASNYDSYGTYDTSSCTYRVVGCDNSNALNYDSQVTAGDVRMCVGLNALRGCTDSNAGASYSALATIDSGTCTYPGCIDSLANNFNPSATFQSGICTYTKRGCTDTAGLNYNVLANEDDESCIYAGCTQTDNPTYDPRASVPLAGAVNGGCLVPRLGCTDTRADNYESSANTDDGSCFLVGCMNNLAPNYDSWAEFDNGRTHPRGSDPHARVRRRRLIC